LGKQDVRYFSKTGSVSKVPYTSIMGTQGYIAPEILAKQHYGTGIDMWAAGVMCVMCIHACARARVRL
jgi:serine/threonine protein kinase